MEKILDCFIVQYKLNNGEIYIMYKEADNFFRRVTENELIFLRNWAEKDSYQGKKAKEILENSKYA